MLKLNRRVATHILGALMVCLTAQPVFAATRLVYWSMWNEAEPQAQALKTIIGRYEKSNPGVTFQVVWNGRQNQTKVRGAIAAGSQIDLVDQDADQIAAGLVRENQAFPLNTLFDAKAPGDSVALRNVLMPGTVDLFLKDGKPYQAPYIYNTVNFWYSKDALTKIAAAVPQSWDELLTMCQKAQAKKLDGLAIESNVASYNALYFSYLVERLKGSGAISRILDDKSGAAWADPAILAASGMERELWDKKCISADARGFQYPQGQQTIAMGETVAELVGSWLPTELADSAGKDFAWGSFPFPTVKGGVGKATDLQAALLSFVVLKNSKNTTQAIDFLKFVLSEPSQKTIAEIGNVGVTRQGVKWPGALASAYAQASKATALTPLVGGMQTKLPDFYATIFEPLHNQMFLGQITPENFVKTLQAKTKEYWNARASGQAVAQNQRSDAK
jgi:raffinose/stachyose/melibiose transport system substrate-binding protein